MRYSVAIFRLKSHEEWQKDVLCQELADQGFEMFESSEDGTELRAYAPSALGITGYRDNGITKGIGDWAELVGIEECPDEDWNAEWEKENEEKEYDLGGQTLRIRPKCAFGAGHHETTAMMLKALTNRRITGSRDNGITGYRDNGIPKERTVLDNGCGTGILGIAAALLGAEKVVATDIDDKAVRNTEENAALNGVEAKMDIRLGDTPPEGEYDLIMSNIHRNILIAQMPLYARYIKPGGEVWLSGFLRDDRDAIREAAEREGLQVKQEQERNEWILLQLYRPLTA